MTPIPGHAGCRLGYAVLETPEIAVAHRVEAAVPTADGGILQRLRKSADDVKTRRAGGTAMVDAWIRHPKGPSTSRPLVTLRREGPTG